MRNQRIWFPIDVASNGVVHARVSRQKLSETGFLFEPFPGPVEQRALSSAEVTLNPPAAFIFHTAFCCSTLLARALDVPGRSISLKEPNILMAIANQMRVSNTGDPSRTWAIAAPGLSAAGSAGEQVIVKPTNAANRAVPLLMQTPGAKAIVITSDFDAFILSIARKGEPGRQFVRRLYNIFSLDSAFAQSLPQRDVFTLSDLQIAALVWGMQCNQLNAAIAQKPNAYRILHADDFLKNREQALAACSRHLELALSSDHVEAQAHSDVFTRHSKDAGEAYDRVLRQQERQAADQQFADGLAFVREWATKLPLPLSIKAPLLFQTDPD